MEISVTPAELRDILQLRECYRGEMNCQVVHDSLHRRPGWTVSYLLRCGPAIAGYGTVAAGGPWDGRPTIFEFYVLPDYRLRSFALFEQFLAVSGATSFEVQSNDGLVTTLLHTYAGDIRSEKIVFADAVTTELPSEGAVLRAVTPEAEVLAFRERRSGCADWHLEWQGQVVASGGLCFHYNASYADVFMDVGERWRRQGFGALIVQELKRTARALGQVPAARCSPDNVASRRTLQKAGFVPYAHILLGELRAGAVP